MREIEGAAQLQADIKRWRSRLSEAEPTYCQGVANKAAKQFESLLKQLAARRVTAAGRDLDSLLDEIKYRGDARSIEKLPMGTVTQLILRLTEYDKGLAEACPAETRKALSTIVEIRNETTHELAPTARFAATRSLLEFIEGVLARDTFSALL